MKKYKAESFHEESFIEDLLISFEIDIDKSKITAKLSSCETIEGVMLKNVTMIIEGWKNYKIVKRENEEIDSPGKELSNLLTKPRSIMKYIYENNKLILADTGYHCWLNWVFEEPKVTITGEVDPRFNDN